MNTRHEAMVEKMNAHPNGWRTIETWAADEGTESGSVMGYIAPEALESYIGSWILSATGLRGLVTITVGQHGESTFAQAVNTSGEKVASLYIYP